MLLTISTTHHPATDLGFLLHKNPARTQSFDLSFGRAHVFYTESDETRCTAALMLDVDPVGLVRGRRGPPGEGRTLEQYVNDRPYVASSFLSVAIAQILSSALSGTSRERPDLASAPIPLIASIPVLPAKGGVEFVVGLFQPLGYEVTVQPTPLDPKIFPNSAAPYVGLTLAATCRLTDLLSHLYVLIPVLDNDKHYWVGEDEVEKLLRHGAGWLAAHPLRDEITFRYLKRRRNLARAALERLTAEDDADPDDAAEKHDHEEAVVEERVRLNDQRLGAVTAALRQCGARRVLDLGCGEGRLIQALLKHRQFELILGLDVSHRALDIAADRLHLDRLPPLQKQRIQLIHGALTYRDSRLAGFDAASIVEVIEHLDPPRLAAMERCVFEFARPKTVVITTPNIEFNVRFETLPAGKLRHRDHRFEWTRSEFQTWAGRVAARFNYTVRFVPIGPDDAEVGSPTQMAVFEVCN